MGNRLKLALENILEIKVMTKLPPHPIGDPSPLVAVRIAVRHDVPVDAEQ